MATDTYEGGDPYESDTTAARGESGVAGTGYGWVALAWITLGFAGVFGFIDGILAISKESYYDPSASYVVVNLEAWGAIIVVISVVQVAAAGALVLGVHRARWYAVGAAVAGAFGQLLFSQAYPFWSMAMVAVNVLAIFALTVHGQDWDQI